MCEEKGFGTSTLFFTNALIYVHRKQLDIIINSTDSCERLRNAFELEERNVSIVKKQNILPLLFFPNFFLNLVVSPPKPSAQWSVALHEQVKLSEVYSED